MERYGGYRGVGVVAVVVVGVGCRGYRDTLDDDGTDGGHCHEYSFRMLLKSIGGCVVCVV